MGDRTLDYVALCILVFVILTIIYGIIYIHDIPYEIAKKRNHPHQDAIHTAGWVSLFLMHTIWPFLWIWATLYKPDKGWGLSGHKEHTEPVQPSSVLAEQIAQLEIRLTSLEQQKKSEELSYAQHLKELTLEFQKLRNIQTKGENA